MSKGQCKPNDENNTTAALGEEFVDESQSEKLTCLCSALEIQFPKVCSVVLSFLRILFRPYLKPRGNPDLIAHRVNIRYSFTRTPSAVRNLLLAHLRVLPIMHGYDPFHLCSCSTIAAGHQALATASFKVIQALFVLRVTRM